MIKVEVVTPERIVHQTEGDEIVIPTVEGQIGVRKGHLPLITLLKAGQMAVKKDSGEEELYAIAGGFAEISNDTVRILANTAERAEELDELAIKEAITRAERLKVEAANTHEFSDAAALIEANLARLKVVQRRKARSHRRPLGE